MSIIYISKNLQLQPIEKSDTAALYKLMQKVYIPAYANFWRDKGEWYLQEQYSESNIQREINEEYCSYYFILYQGKKIGNFRIKWNASLPQYSHLKSVKLHRIYLHPKEQGKGIGSQLLGWLEQEAIVKKYKIIWLDAMDKKLNALEFYKKLGYQYHSHCFLDFPLMYDKYRKMVQLIKVLV
ncbi:GNAT family N-acetyltransferase [Tenacibaculum sp. SG-28]|uniref:GNAT family N-acetyltransferase n=1 Tax=Tenacibaculum sp. SG-28 TaxID=754426 RepID=UPI001E4F8FA5|nr:GNAT family N-acetyltransferase [Tenacibaculum sp. SG-28]